MSADFVYSISIEPPASFITISGQSLMWQTTDQSASWITFENMIVSWSTNDNLNVGVYAITITGVIGPRNDAQTFTAT